LGLVPSTFPFPFPFPLLQLPYSQFPNPNSGKHHVTFLTIAGRHTAPHRGRHCGLLAAHRDLSNAGLVLRF